MKELRDMKARVSERPCLFEQVKQVRGIVRWKDYIPLKITCASGITLSFCWQKNAKAHAEQTYRNKLKKAGLKERFVEENGEAVEGTSTSSRSEDDTDENDIHNRYAKWEFLASFVHPLCNTTVSGKIMNSTGAGEPRTSCGLVILHYIIFWACPAVFSEERQIL